MVIQLPDGSIRTKVEPVYAFPVSETSRYISLIDEEPNEIGIIEDISQGDVQFGLRSRYDIVTLENGRVLIKDADGNRYEIENYNKLDPKSIALLETQM